MSIQEVSSDPDSFWLRWMDDVYEEEGHRYILEKHSFCLLLSHLDKCTFDRNSNEKLRISDNFSIYTDRVSCECISHISGSCAEFQ